MRSAAPQKLVSGSALRNSVMNVFTCARPRRGACREYCKRISGAPSSSTTAGFHGLPQNSANQRPTIALFSCSFDMVISSLLLLGSGRGDSERRSRVPAHRGASRLRLSGYCFRSRISLLPGTKAIGLRTIPASSRCDFALHRRRHLRREKLDRFGNLHIGQAADVDLRHEALMPEQLVAMEDLVHDLLRAPDEQRAVAARELLVGVAGNLARAILVGRVVAEIAGVIGIERTHRVL